MPNGHADEFMADNVKSVSMDEVTTVDGALTLQLKTGAHPENTSFEVKNMDTGEIDYYFTFEQANHVYKEDFVLPNDACYRLTIRDAAGEGMGSGYFQVKDPNNTIVFKGGSSAGRFTYELATELDCNGVAALEENDLETFSVVPNPTSGVVQLNLGKGQWLVQVYDITGRKVMEQQCEMQSTLDLSQQQKGLYLLKAQNGIEEVIKKIVVR